MRPLIACLCILSFALPAAGCLNDGVGPGPDEWDPDFRSGDIDPVHRQQPHDVQRHDGHGGGAARLDRGRTDLRVAADREWYRARGPWNFGGLEAIRSGQWDFVVLQQGPSATEGRPSLWEFAERFAVEIRSVGATPALFMVWPSVSRSFDFDGVSESYAEAARLANGVLLPAGDVCREAWSHDASLPFYSPDQFHPSQLGSYAAALTIAAGLSGEDAFDFPHSFRMPSGQVVVVGEVAAGHVKAAVAALAAG